MSEEIPVITATVITPDSPDYPFKSIQAPPLRSQTAMLIAYEEKPTVLIAETTVIEAAPSVKVEREEMKICGAVLTAHNEKPQMRVAAHDNNSEPRKLTKKEAKIKKVFGF